METRVLEADLSLKQLDALDGVKAASEWLIRNAEETWVCDAANLEAYDSATLALFLHWIRLSRSVQSTIIFTNLPAGLLSLADLYGIKKLLPLSTA